jgi:predicted O-methyltransferase YrrM
MRPYINILKEIVIYCQPGEDINILEIGVRRGTSTRALLAGLVERDRYKFGDGHLHSLDIINRSNVVVDAAQIPKWTFTLGDSHMVEWNMPVDILFIDGDHSYSSVALDYAKYEPYVKNGGLILFHDAGSTKCEVKKFWDSGRITYPHIVLRLNEEGLGIVTKI